MHGNFVAKNFNLTHLNLLHPLGVNVAQWIYVVSYITKLCVIKVNGIWNKGIIALVFIASLKSTDMRLYMYISRSKPIINGQIPVLEVSRITICTFPSTEANVSVCIFRLCGSRICYDNFNTVVNIRTTWWRLYLLVKATVINLSSIQ